MPRINKSSLVIGVDFDGTMVEHWYPYIGLPNPGAIETCKWLIDQGHKIVLWTMRHGKELDDAVEYMVENGIDLYGINTNPTQKAWTDSPKAYCQIFIDDAGLGIPLEESIQTNRPRVNWTAVRRLLEAKLHEAH